MLTDYQKAFVAHWKSLDFSDWNETDVREEFIAPLLNFLGYSKGTVNTIVREKQAKLTQPYHRVGRDKVIIDYVPSVKLKNFWIIEAKPGNVLEMEFGDLLQAHLYAVHPEIQVPYFVLCNGHEIRIYDSHTVSSWDDAICVSNKQDAEDTFPGIVEVLSATSLLAFHRNRTLSNIESVFENEIDTRELARFKADIDRTVKELEQKVRANADEFQRKVFREDERKYLDELQDLDLELLLVHMDIPTNTGPQPSNEVIRRLRVGDDAEKKRIVNKLAMTFRGRPHTIFRVHTLKIICECLSICPDLKGDLYFSSIPELINELATGNLTYCVEIPLHNALWHYDNICLRVAKKVMMKKNLDTLARVVQDRRTNMPAEDLLRENPHLERSVIHFSGLTAESLWRVAVSSDPETIWQTFWLLQAFEEILDGLPDRKNTEYGGDFLWLEHYGIDYDMLIFGSWGVLTQYPQIASMTTIKSEVAEFAKLSREEVVNRLPKPSTPPEKWEVDERTFERLMQQILRT